MKKVFLPVLSFLLILSVCVYAGVETKTTVKTAQGEGFGKSYEEALEKALLDAVGRLGGGKLAVFNFSGNKIVQEKKNKKQENEFNQYIVRLTQGRFDSYEVLSRQKVEDGYYVKVEIKQSKTKKYYKAPGLDPKNRLKITVVPLLKGDFQLDVDGKQFDAFAVTQNLTQLLVSDLAASRKFAVLDRSTDKVYEREEKILRSGSAAPDEVLKLGNVLGADYLLAVSLSDFSMQKVEKRNDLTGVVKKSFEIRSGVDYKILIMATRQVEFAENHDFSFSLQAENEKECFALAMQKIADTLIKNVINVILSLKIADVKKEVIFAEKLSIDDVYDVYDVITGASFRDNSGKKIIDYQEIKIGTVKIIRVEAGKSYGKIVSGKAKKGNICRLQKRIAAENGIFRPDVTEEEKPDNVQKNADGGVVLPFD